jgi:hypothetical protein
MRINKKIAGGVVAGAVLIAGGGAAWAYWSSTGTGSGTATTATGASSLTLVQTSTITDLAPGGAPQAIAGTVTNNASNSAHVGSVTVSIGSVKQAAGATGSCDASDYTIADGIMTVNQDIAAGSSANFSGATIVFNNKTTNQDGCKGATVNLDYAAS